jgi:YD repeat-containing protein
MQIFSRMCGLSFAAASLVAAAPAVAIDLAPPRMQVVDKFGVNVANGQVTNRLTTVAIGGELGLSHEIAAYTNQASVAGMRGYQDKFYAKTRYVHIVDQYMNHPSGLDVLRVHDFADTVDFKIMVGGVEFSGAPGGITSNYTYLALGDDRHTLTVNGDHLEWTKPDGTVVRFLRGPNPHAGSEGLMDQIIYPNGFTITISSLSVNTNTGFQLKYALAPDNRPLDKPDIVSPYLPTADSAQWALFNPKFIRAINNAVEYCSPTATDCTLTRSWPAATFSWPAGMPRSLYLGDSALTVTDAGGGATIYRFRAYDLCLDNGNPVAGCTVNQRFSPRLLAIRPAASTADAFTYNYKNVYSILGSDSTYVQLVQEAGVVTGATRMGASGTYQFNQTYYSDFQNFGPTKGGVLSVANRNASTLPGNVIFVDTVDGRMNYEYSFRNFPSSYLNNTGPREDYLYTRGNLTKITYNQNDAIPTIVQASYPATCTNPKTCNQANSITDARGNTTTYTYHAQSGQVATITSPPNKSGIAAQTRYEYTQKSASYYAGGANKISGSPIWLRTAERHCVNSSYVSGACQGADEVVTRYEYNNDNLLMTGMTVTDASGKTLRTCYQYDIYGNQIGKTEPRANLASCN